MYKVKEQEIKEFAAQIRLETVKTIGTRGFGHLGGSLSIVDLLAVLYGSVMRVDPDNPKWEDRDLLVMSKGHAGPAVYSALALKGFFPKEWLKTLNQPGTFLPSHCDCSLTPGIDMTTGSLGQGASLAVGMALGRKISGNDGHVYLVIGDGECDEGQIWEAAMFASHHKLNNMTWFVDYNGKQLDGKIDEVLNLRDIRLKFEEFGFSALSIDGNDVVEIHKAIQDLSNNQDKPGLVVLNTIKGKGITAVENMEMNHHIKLSEIQIGEMIDEAEKSIDLLREEAKFV